MARPSAKKTSAARFVPERFFLLFPCRFAVQHHPAAVRALHVKRGGPPFAIVQHRAVLQRIHQRVSATFCSTLGSVTFFACKKVQAGPGPARRMASSKCPVFACACPFSPAIQSAWFSIFAAGREKPLKRYCILVHCPLEMF